VTRTVPTSRSAPETAAAVPRPPARFRGLITEKTRGFVGREHVFAEIDAWTRAHPHGYLTIRGDPGVGKSAIIARQVQREPGPVYFNQRVCGLTQARQFLHDMCRQLAEWFAVDEDRLAAMALADGGTLAELLDHISPRIAGGRLVIAVDALDEVDLGAQERGSNVLYLPPCLPDGVFFLLTQRRLPLPLVTDTPMHTVDLMDARFEAHNRADTETYLRLSLDIPAVRDWVSRQGLAPTDYVDQLATKSNANFMYLHHVVADIAAGRLSGQSARSLPEGLLQYYASHWRLMGMDDASPLARTKLETLYVLLEYQEPVSVELLARITGKPATAVAAANTSCRRRKSAKLSW
jgi:hypothetical protein